MIYLVLISLVLHLISFFIIVVLFQRLDNQKPLDKEKTLKEMEDLLISYTTEMKENNEKLARRMAHLTPAVKATPVVTPKPSFEQKETEPFTEEVDELNSKNDKEDVNERVEETSDTKYAEYEPPLPSSEKEDIVEPSDTSKVLSLSKQGYTEQEIAKKLDMGAGEVALLLKFYKN
jgi:DNA repair exonuclease SbcCD nuclease subunit